MPQSASRRVAGVLVAGLVLVAAVLAGASSLLWPATSRSGGFALARAQADLRVVAAAPHSLGSPANAAVRDLLLAQLRGMGLAPEVQRTTVTILHEESGAVWTAPVQNVVARLKGTDARDDDAVLLAAHYDSASGSPGAGDNGAGVVATLETLRVLVRDPPRHDVVVVFADGEEHEMLGSRGFTDAHPWARSVRAVVNTEAIGTAGVAVVTGTIARDGWLLRHYLGAVESPAVFTALTAPLNAAGIGADLVQYRAKVPAGIELTAMDGIQNYHTGTDEPARVTRGLLAHEGATVLALTRRLANADLAPASADDLVAFSLARGVTVAYSARWSLPLAALAALVVVAAVTLAVRRRRVRLPRVAEAVLGLAVGVGLALLVPTLVWAAARTWDPRLQIARNGLAAHRLPLLLGFTALALACVALPALALRRRHRPLEVAGGALVGWALLALLVAVALPAAAYWTTWPLFAASAAFAVLAAREWGVGGTTAIVIAGTVPAALLTAPLVFLFHQLSAYVEVATDASLIALPMLPAALGLALVVPLLAVALGRSWWVPAVAGVTGAALILGGLLAGGFDARHPRPNLLAYRLDLDTGRATWVALPERLDAYTAQVAAVGSPGHFVPSPFHRPRSGRPARVADAPVVPLPRPDVKVLSDTTRGGQRALALRVVAAPDVTALTLELTGGGALTVDGRLAPAARGVLFAAASAATPVTVTVPVDRSPLIRMTAYWNGLPPALGGRLRARAREQTTGLYELADPTVVTRTILLP